MVPSTREIEVKLPFATPEEARDLLRRSGARLTRDREFEENVVFDRPDDGLRNTGRLLRLRRTPRGSRLTFKAPVPGEHRHKVRLELETEVSHPEMLEGILEGLDYAPSYRYQKYRTVYRIDQVEACLDETPIGCFVELEGDPDAIDRVAARLGFSPDRYVLATYRQIHEEWALARGRPPGDLVFGDRAPA